jgi:hypothetical protein
MKEKSFITLTPGVSVIKLFFFVAAASEKKQLVCLCQTLSEFAILLNFKYKRVAKERHSSLVLSVGNKLECLPVTSYTRVGYTHKCKTKLKRLVGANTLS